jgi:hypothetical protein
MADVTGPISTLPGASYEAPEGTMCDNHPDRPATGRVQGETDSFGCEMHDLCDECSKEHREELRAARESLGTCDWCDAQNVKVRFARDYEEGMCGRVYSVCYPCKDRYDKRVTAELDCYGDYDD